jgi:hypothetical protein
VTVLVCLSLVMDDSGKCKLPFTYPYKQICLWLEVSEPFFVIVLFGNVSTPTYRRDVGILLISLRGVCFSSGFKSKEPSTHWVVRITVCFPPVSISSFTFLHCSTIKLPKVKWSKAQISKLTCFFNRGLWG